MMSPLGCGRSLRHEVVPIRPGKLNDQLYEAASVSIENIAVTDGFMGIHLVLPTGTIPGKQPSRA